MFLRSCFCFWKQVLSLGLANKARLVDPKVHSSQSLCFPGLTLLRINHLFTWVVGMKKKPSDLHRKYFISYLSITLLILFWDEVSLLSRVALNFCTLILYNPASGSWEVRLYRHVSRCTQFMPTLKASMNEWLFNYLKTSLKISVGRYGSMYLQFYRILGILDNFTKIFFLLKEIPKPGDDFGQFAPIYTLRIMNKFSIIT